METTRYQKYKNLLKKHLTFTATYIKNGSCKGSGELTVLLANVQLNGEEVLDHVWIISNKLAKMLASKQHRQIDFEGTLIKLKKPYTLYERKTDLGLRIEKIV